MSQPPEPRAPRTGNAIGGQHHAQSCALPPFLRINLGLATAESALPITDYRDRQSTEEQIAHCVL